MRAIIGRSALALGSLAVLSGCVVVPAYYEPLPPAGSTLPATASGGSAAGIEDYLYSAPGSRLVRIDGKVQTIDYGSAIMADALVYDADYDEWVINVDGRNHYLAWNGAGGYDDRDICLDECAELSLYDNNPYASQYGTFGYVGYEAPGRTVEYFLHAGLKTPEGSMPIGGSANYYGEFNGVVNYTDAALAADWDYIAGPATVTANFAPTGGSIGFASDGTGTYAGSAYSLTGGGAISGNRYLGAVTGWYDDGAGGDLVLDAASSTLSGAFYGPAAEETAGVVYATSSPADPYWGEVAGGFWGAR